MTRRRVLVAGGGGFIGSHLVERLVKNDHHVRVADLARPRWSESPADEFMQVDLRDPKNARDACEGMDDVYHLAASMGGMGFISAHHADVAHGNVLIDAHMVDAARHHSVKRYLYTSSACAYPTWMQAEPTVRGLREEDAWPAMPEEGYGLEKLYSEKLCAYFRADYGLQTTVVRLHNVYGPKGTYDGGREKAPAALCRKVAAMIRDGEREVNIWGDGEQTRSFCYVDDCVDGLLRLMEAGVAGPVNLGSEQCVSVRQLLDLVLDAAGVRGVTPTWDTSQPQGVRGRNSDNAMLRRVLDGWEPTTTLSEGIARTYAWVRAQVLQG